MKYCSILFCIFTILFASCSEDTYEIKFKKEMLVGYWAITHIQTIEHVGGVHNTFDRSVPPHGLDAYACEENYRWDVLIFDKDFVTVRGDMPNRPKEKDFDINTTDGQVQYLTALETWYNNIGPLSDQNACPVGKYSIRDGNLFFSSMNMGQISFASDNEFTLTYSKNKSDGYVSNMYTYTRIYSLNM